MPSIEIVRGRTSRWLSRCSRSHASSVDAGGVCRSAISTSRTSRVTRRTSSGPARAVSSAGASLPSGLPSAGAGNQASSTAPVSSRVTRAWPHAFAGVSLTRATLRSAGCRHPRLGSPRGPRAVEGGRPADLRAGPAARRATPRRPARRGPAPDGAAGRADRAAGCAERRPGAVEPARVGVRPGRAARPDRPAGADRAPGLRPAQRGPRAVPGRDVDLAGPRAAQGVAARQRARGSRPTTAAGGRSSTSCGGRGRCRPARSRTPARCRGRPRAGTTTRTSRCCSS